MCTFGVLGLSCASPGGPVWWALLFSLGQHPALEAVQKGLRNNEKVFAFLDDIVVVCSPDRVVAVEAVLREELHRCPPR